MLGVVVKDPLMLEMELGCLVQLVVVVVVMVYVPR
jgi:hypothetical protein